MLVAAAMGLAACGDDDEPAAGTPPATTQAAAPGQPDAPEQPEAPGAPEAVEVEIEAVEEDGRLSFSEESLQVAAGTVTLTMRNPDGNEQAHGVAIMGGNGQQRDGATVKPGGSSSVTVQLQPGDYTFLCPVGVHRSKGMEGVLVVE